MLDETRAKANHVAGTRRWAGALVLGGALAVLADGNLTIVLEASNVANPQYSPSGHIVFARAAPNAGLWAVPFNAPGRTVTGEPFLIGRGTEPSLALDGTLVFQGADRVTERRLAWFTMDGRVGDTIAISPPCTTGISYCEIW